MLRLQWSAAVLAALCAPSIWAQSSSSSPGSAQSLGKELFDEGRSERPLSPPSDTVPLFRLPDLLQPAPDVQPLSRRLKVFCRDIRLQGNTVAPAHELASLLAPYRNRYLGNQDLQQLRHDLTRYYVDRGYINSGAVIPDQNVKDGIIEIRIFEGRLQRIDIEGNEHFRQQYLLERIEKDAVEPLQIDRLQENLQLLLENPLIERINADLQPGVTPGLAILKTVLKERSPYQLGAVFDNQIAPSIGAYQGTVYAGYRNLTGHGDALTAQGRFAEGLTNFGFDYWLPVNRYDTTVHAWYAHYDSILVERPFNQIDVTSNSEAYGMSVVQPFYRKPGRSFSGTLTLERRRSKTFLLDMPFSFSPGVQNGESSVTVLRVGQEWIKRSTEQVVAVRSTFNMGFDALDATINQGLPDGRFFSWLGQAQWAWRLGSAQIIWRADVQLTNDRLLPLEKFQVGGANSVRGYRENQLVRDWGFSSSVEYRHPLFSETLGGDKLFVAPFADVGGAWDTRAAAPAANDLLLSLGLGLIFEPDRRFHCHLYWGKALIETANNPYRDPQDYGFHFKVSAHMF